MMTHVVRQATDGSIKYTRSAKRKAFYVHDPAGCGDERVTTKFMGALIPTSRIAEGGTRTLTSFTDTGF